MTPGGAGRIYGQHRAEDAPRTVTVLGPEKWPVSREVPIPAALLRQRGQVNARAHERSREHGN